MCFSKGWIMRHFYEVHKVLLESQILNECSPCELDFDIRLIWMKWRETREKKICFWKTNCALCYGLTHNPGPKCNCTYTHSNVLLMTIVPITFRPLHSFCCAIAENMKEKKKKRPCSIKSKIMWMRSLWYSKAGPCAVQLLYLEGN